MSLVLTPPEVIRRSASISSCGRFRFTLTRVWTTGRSHVCFIGHNPSVADASVDDPTVRRWTHFARSWGYGGFVAVNLYPLRSPNPSDALRWADWERTSDWYARDVLFQNQDIVVREAKAAGLVVACWGAIATDFGWVDHIVEEVTFGEEPWPTVHTLGFTSAGVPKHPMARGKHRVPNDQRPVVWKRGATASLSGVQG